MQRAGFAGLGLIGLVLTILGGVSLAGSAGAQGWPEKPVPVLIPVAAGSATDTVARTVFEQVGRQIGQPAIIESRPGAGGVTASAAVARADPDGHTVLFTSSAYTITPLLQVNAP